jgi:hypothetical protein
MNMDLRMKEKIVKQVLLGDGYYWKRKGDWRG